MSIDGYPEGSRMTVMLTGGRAPCTLALARLFHAAGHRVLVAESVEHHLCRVSKAVERSFRVPPPNGTPGVYVAALTDIIVKEQVDVLIPTCEEIFFVAMGLNRLAPICRVWAAPIGQLQELHDKWLFAELARRLGLAVPDTCLITSDAEWLALADGGRWEQAGESNGAAGEAGAGKVNGEPGEAVPVGAASWLGGDLVLKPAYSRFASRVLFLDKADTVEARQRLLAGKLPELSAAAPWVAQRRIDGQHLCTYSVAYEGTLIAHAAYPCLYRVGEGATVHYEPIHHEGALDWVRRFAAATGFSGQLAFDFIETAGDGEGKPGVLYAIECNPRSTSGVLLFGSEVAGQREHGEQMQHVRQREHGEQEHVEQDHAEQMLHGEQDNAEQMRHAGQREQDNAEQMRHVGQMGQTAAGHGLAAAFLQPEALRDSGTLLTPGPGAGSVMLSAPMLACGLRSFRQAGGLGRWWRAYRSARDGVFHRSDRRPAVEQLRVLRDAWRVARANGITLTQATTIDLEWNGEA